MQHIKLILFLLLTFSATAQPFVFNHAKNFGSVSDETFIKAFRFSDGSTILIGVTSATNPSYDVSVPSHGYTDYWVVKTDAQDNVLWEKVYGGSASDIPYSAVLTDDDKIFILGGSESSPGGSKTAPYFGHMDAWVVVIDLDGNQLADYSYGTNLWDYPTEIIAGKNDEFIISGSCPQGNGVTGNIASVSQGGEDVFLLKIDAAGTLLAETTLGGPQDEHNAFVLFDSNDRLFVSTNSESGIGGNKTIPSYGDQDIWFVKLDYDFQLIEQASYGGSDVEYSQSSIFANGGLYCPASSQSDISGNKTCPKLGTMDGVLLKIDTSDLSILQQRSYGGQNSYASFLRVESFDNQLLISGTADGPANIYKSNDSFGLADVWLLSVNNDFEPLWNTTYGGTGLDLGATSMFHADGELEIYVSCRAPGTAGNIECNIYGSWDVIHATYSNELGIDEQAKSTVSLWPNPARNTLSLSGISAPEQYTITDVAGKIVGSGTASTQIDVSTLENGVYLLNLPGQAIRFIKE